MAKLLKVESKTKEFTLFLCRRMVKRSRLIKNSEKVEIVGDFSYLRSMIYEIITNYGTGFIHFDDNCSCSQYSV